MKKSIKVPTGTQYGVVLFVNKAGEHTHFAIGNPSHEKIMRLALEVVIRLCAEMVSTLTMGKIATYNAAMMQAAMQGEEVSGPEQTGNPVEN